jgi:hypothetical protein
VQDVATLEIGNVVKKLAEVVPECLVLVVELLSNNTGVVN